jgi:hypothetical protein
MGINTAIKYPKPSENEIDISILYQVLKKANLGLLKV